MAIGLSSPLSKSSQAKAWVSGKAVIPDGDGVRVAGTGVGSEVSVGGTGVGTTGVSGMVTIACVVEVG
jgi:hypothetical protein